MSTPAEDSTTPTVEEGTSSTAIFPTETLSKSQAETETNVSATPSADKGKTRAVTIEDAPESDDEEQQNVDVRVEAATTTGAAVYMKAQEEPLDPIEAAIRRAEQGAGGDGGGEHQGGQQWGQEHDWQAVWSPPQNAYYFYNTKTYETTWTNPLADLNASTAATTTPSGGESPPWDPSATVLPTAGVASGPSASFYPSHQEPSSSSYAPQDEALPEIDPALSHLLPASYDPLNPSSGGAYSAQARFNTRTGRYESDPSRAPDHISAYSRMKRQNEAFFDQAAWEREREEQYQAELAAGGPAQKKKRLTKASIQRFKEAKELKQKKKNAWLRS